MSVFSGKYKYWNENEGKATKVQNKDFLKRGELKETNNKGMSNDCF